MRTASRLVHRAQRLWWSLARPLTLGVRALLIDDGQVTLVRHRYLDGWYLPGGGVRPGETPEQAMRREAREELGATLGDLALFGVYTNFAERKSDYIIVFRAAVVAREQRWSWEIAQVETFALDALPATTSPGTRRRLAEAQAATPPITGPW